ncbi:DUF2461 domain-containing protein [Desertivirga brevis]|uniref:DUF2461 domain-containing protein n=1 Tax=Desertivirga brevis TaxID=2810310 RepID=UPI001A956B79|nr:DUF2461 domain-containing protein [Pedobacter sp. SYSU D00873]
MILPSTFDFLEKLKDNNNRDWFKQNKHLYENSHKNVLEFGSTIIKSLSKIDRTIPEHLDPKDCVMRIYRDIRFSKDKSPYKLNFGIALSANGKNFDGAGYYLHIEPGKCFVGGGAWHPTPELLKSIRQEIDYNGSHWHEIIDSDSFKNTFNTLSVEDKLQTAPKGYPSDHPDIEYLKLKSFVATRALDDNELAAPNAIEIVTDSFEKLYPLIVFLRNANA